MLKARVGQAKVVQPMVERLPADMHRQILHLGEVRQPQPTGLGYLPEDHIAFSTVLCPPITDPPLERAPHVQWELRMPTAQFFEDRDRSQCRSRLQHRHHFLLEHGYQRIRPTPAARFLALRGKPPFLLQPISRRLA